MTRRDATKMQGMFSANFSQKDLDKAMSKLTKFQEKLDAGMFNEFTQKDWKDYFKFKAIEWGVTNYIPGNRNKESAIVKSLMSHFTVYEIKSMIDFVWECDEHNLVKHKSTMGIWVLSSGYLQSVTQLMQIWKKDGTLNKQNKPLIESNWEIEENTPARKKKPRISIGGM